MKISPKSSFLSQKVSVSVSKVVETHLHGELKQVKLNGIQLFITNAL